MAHYQQDTVKGKPFELQNGHSGSTTNIERYSVLIKSFLTTVGSDVLRSLLTETAENSKCTIGEFLYQYQTSIIYALQHRMRNKLQLVYPLDDEELDLQQWNCRLLCLVIRATDRLDEKLLDDVTFIERTYIKHSKDEITLMRRSTSSYGKQLQPKKEWIRVCGSMQRLAEHVRDTRLLNSVRNFIYKVEMGTKLMDARIETHLSLTKMISELAASHSDRMTMGDSVYAAPLGMLTKVKQQYDMVSKPSFSESRSNKSLSRTMFINGEPTRPLSSRDRDLSEKPAKSTSVIILSPECKEVNQQDSRQIKRSNTSELIANQNQNTNSPPKRHRPFSNTGLSRIPSQSVKLLTPRMSLSKQNDNMNDETIVDSKCSEYQALENIAHCNNICTDKDNEMVKTNIFNNISVKRQVKTAPTESRNTGKLLSSRNTNEIHHNLNNSSVSHPHSFDITRSISRTKRESSKNGDHNLRETNQLLRNTVPLHNLNSTKKRENSVVEIYTTSLKLPSKVKIDTDKGDKKQLTIVKPDLRKTVAERQDMALKLIQQPEFSSLVAYTMKYQRSMQKKKLLSSNAKESEKVDKIEDQDKNEKPLADEHTENDETKIIIEDKDSTDEFNKTFVEIENKDIIDKIQTRRKSTFGRLKDLFKNVLLPNKHGSESSSSHNSSGTLSKYQTPVDSFSENSPSKSGTFEQLLSQISPGKTTLSATQSDGYKNSTTVTETSQNKTIETETTRDNQIDTEKVNDNKKDAGIPNYNKIDEMSNTIDSKIEKDTYINNMQTANVNKTNAQTKMDNTIHTETTKDNEIDNQTANEHDAKINELKTISEATKITSSKHKPDENKGCSIKELKKTTRVKFTQDYENLCRRYGQESFNHERKRRQSLPLLSFQKKDDDSQKEKARTENQSKSMIVAHLRSSMSPPPSRRASATASSLREVAHLQKPKMESDKLKHTQNVAPETSREMENGDIEENSENNSDVKFREDISQMEKNSNADIKETTYASNKVSADANSPQSGKQKGKAKNFAHRRKSIAVGQLSSSMQVRSNLNRTLIARSNSESELNTSIVNEQINESRPNTNDIPHSIDNEKTQGSFVQNRKKAVILNSTNATAKSNDRTEVEHMSQATDKNLESKLKQLPITQKSFAASSFRKRPLDHKKEFVRAKSESEFNMSALKEANQDNDSEYFKNRDKKTEIEQKENGKHSHKSLLDGALLYDDDLAKTNDSSKRHINESQSVSDESQNVSNEAQKIVIQTQILTENAESAKVETDSIEHAKVEIPEKDEISSTKDVPSTTDDVNDESVDDPEAEMKKIANDVIVHHQVHKAAREFMEKDKEFVDKFFTFLHKYQATKEFLKTTQYSPFKTLKLPTGIKASLSFIHAYTFRHVNVFDRDQCNHVVEKILKRTECEEAKKFNKVENEIITRIDVEIKFEKRKSESNKDDRKTHSRKSKNKVKAKRGTNQDTTENKHIDMLMKDLEKLEGCQCWKCRQKDLAMTIAVNWRNHGICELLLKYGVQFKMEHLLPAVRANDGENVKRIVDSLKQRHVWDSSHEEARMALILARFHSMQDIVIFLKKEGVQDERVVQCACFA